MLRSKRNSSQETDASEELPPLSPAVPPPPLEWTEQSQRLGPLLRHNSVPFVVMCDKRCLPSMGNVNFDFSQPLLLHTRRTVRKVVASNLIHMQNGGTSQVREVGDRLLIPEDYKGWFAVLGSPADAKTDKVVPHFRQVAKLALSKCQSFLIGGNEPVAAVLIPSSGSGGDSRPQQRLLYPGDVLRMGTLYSAETTLKVKSGPFRGKKTIKKEEKFLLCTDEHDREVYLPVEKSGIFYVLTIEGQVTPKIPILRMPDICARFRFPCIVKLLYGRVPPTPCSFTGTLLLQDSQIEASVIGCTILNLRNILLDIPIDSDLKFFFAHSTPELLMSKAYKSALRLCQEMTPTYMRNMKVAYYIGGDEDATKQRSINEQGNGTSEESSPDAQSSGFSPFRTSIISHSALSVVEEQPLFIPPEYTSQPAPLAGNRKSKKTSTADNTASIDHIPRTASSNSPTVLRRDTTFELPEPREVLPVRQRTLSAPSLSISELKLTAVSESGGEGQTPQSNHYMTMDESEAAIAGSADRQSSVGMKKKAPVPPPKPSERKPLTHTSSEGNFVYDQAWNGEKQVFSPTEKQAPSAGSEQPQGAAMRPKNLLSVPPVAHRVSSIAFADNYLTFPVFRTQDSSPSSTATTPASEQPYETMVSPKARQDTEASGISPTPRKSKPLPVPPRPKLDSPSSETSSPKSKPVPVPPRPGRGSKSSSGTGSPGSEPTVSRENSCSSDKASPAAGKNWSQETDTYAVSKSLFRETSYTYYEGYDPAVNINTGGSPPSGSPLNRWSSDYREEVNTERAPSTANSDEVMYVNVQNLQRLMEQRNTTGAVHESAYVLADPPSGTFIQLENPPSIFGYVSPPPPRGASPDKSHAATAASLQNPEPPSRPPFQTYTNLSGRPLPAPPRPCGGSNPYLQPCGQMNEDIPRTDTAQYSETASRANFDDDLPLGATFACFNSARSSMSDSGCPLESVAESGDGASSEVSSMSVACLSDALKNCGLRPETIETLREEKVDGRLLASLNENELREALPGVKNLDIKKIRMFVNGWRPME